MISAPWTKNISAFAAMNKYEILNHKIYNPSINSQYFKQYIIVFSSVFYLKQIDNPIFILDDIQILYYNVHNEMIKYLI